MELINSEALKAVGLKDGQPGNKKTLVLIYVTSSDKIRTEEEAIKEDIFKRNMCDCNISEDEFNEEFLINNQFSWKECGKVRKITMLVEYPVRIGKWLRSNCRVFNE